MHKSLKIFKFLKVCTILSGIALIAYFLFICISTSNVILEYSAMGMLTPGALLEVVVASTLQICNYLFLFAILVGIYKLYSYIIVFNDLTKDETKTEINETEEVESKSISMKMKKEKLIDIAKSLDIEVSNKDKKQEIINKINNKLS